MPIYETVNTNDTQNPNENASSNPPNMVYGLVSSFVGKYGGFDVLNGKEITSVLTEFVDKDENSALTVFIDGQIKKAKDDIRNEIKTKLNETNDPLMSTEIKPEEIYRDFICSQKVKFTQADSDLLIPDDSLKEIDELQHFDINTDIMFGNEDSNQVILTLFCIIIFNTVAKWCIRCLIWVYFKYFLKK